jgi:hypothetical protein
MRIYNDQGITIKGAASFTYKGHAIVLSTLDGIPVVQVTINDSSESFSSMDDAIGRVDAYSQLQWDLDSYD